MFSDAIYKGSEADGLVPVTVVATGVVSLSYTVVITPTESSPVSAQAGIDFVNHTYSLTFNDTSLEQQANIIIFPDTPRTGTSIESFIILLSLTPDLKCSGVTVGSPSRAVVVLSDTS